MKGSRYRVTSTASLDDGIGRQQFPVATGMPRDVTMGVAREMALASTSMIVI